MSKDAKHTPGPWRVRRTGGIPDAYVAEVSPFYIVAADDMPLGVEAADAALIAAAPDMADAHAENARILGDLVRELRGLIEGGKLTALADCLARSLVALAKARGQ